MLSRKEYYSQLSAHAGNVRPIDVS
jgi:hypothetical protein